VGVGVGRGVGRGVLGAVVVGSGEGDAEGPADPGLEVGFPLPRDGVLLGVPLGCGPGEGAAMVACAEELDGRGAIWDGNAVLAGGLAQAARVAVRIPAPARTCAMTRG
jgi:hypothetical protein